MLCNSADERGTAPGPGGSLHSFQNNELSRSLLSSVVGSSCECDGCGRGRADGLEEDNPINVSRARSLARSVGRSSVELVGRRTDATTAREDGKSGPTLSTVSVSLPTPILHPWGIIGRGATRRSIASKASENYHLFQLLHQCELAGKGETNALYFL